MWVTLCILFIYSNNDSSKTYVGYTTNIEQRLETHNSGGSVHTKSFSPWKLVSYVAFDTESKALSFEKYIKAGSGYAFAKKRLW